MRTELQEWLNAPIPRKRALGALLASNGVQAFVLSVAVDLLKQQRQNQVILRESLDILIEKADPETVARVNEKLEFWLVVKERNLNPPEPQE